jgi:acetyltransferase-like isoleucine patch superfamily enzyme
MPKSKFRNPSVIIGKNCKIDPSAIIGALSPGQNKNDKTIIGDNAIIRSGTVIYAGTKIGKNLQTGHNVTIREKNIIENNFSIWTGSVIDYGCKIGNNVKIHCNCYVAQFTTIENGVFLAPGVVTTNDPHPGCKFAKQCMCGPVLKKNAQIGANSTIVPFVTVGESALIGAGSIVTKNIPHDVIAYGNPARIHGKISSLKCLFDYTDKPYSKDKYGKKKK